MLPSLILTEVMVFSPFSLLLSTLKVAVGLVWLWVVVDATCCFVVVVVVSGSWLLLGLLATPSHDLSVGC